jgi:hypothetical protein
MSAIPHANGGLLLHDLVMPDFRTHMERSLALHQLLPVPSADGVPRNRWPKPAGLRVHRVVVCSAGRNSVRRSTAR